MNDLLDLHLQELRRGTVVLACLQLLRTPGYGYGLLEDLERHGFATDANTLYPLLRRLEKQEFLTSAWNTDEARPRKFYRTSPAGERLADSLTTESSALTGAIRSLTATDPVADQEHGHARDTHHPLHRPHYPLPAHRGTGGRYRGAQGLERRPRR